MDISPDSPVLEGTLLSLLGPDNSALGQTGGMRPATAGVELAAHKEGKPPRAHHELQAHDQDEG